MLLSGYALFKDVYQKDADSDIYVTATDLENGGDIKLTVKKGDFKLLPQMPYPYVFEAEVKGRLFGLNMALVVETMTCNFRAMQAPPELKK